MDLLTTCPFRSLMMVFFAVPIGVIAAVYGAEISAGLRRHGWRARHH